MTNPVLITLYGIKNCDSVKKARSWLDAQPIVYAFHDYRVEGLSAELLEIFVEQLGIDAILNQRSTSWRQLDDAQKQNLTAEKAQQLILSNPTLLKRPIVAIGEQLLVGFNPDTYTKAL
jgi:Spx/MgsR family transcriptional regulator